MGSTKILSLFLGKTNRITKDPPGGWLDKLPAKINIFVVIKNQFNFHFLIFNPSLTLATQKNIVTSVKTSHSCF